MSAQQLQERPKQQQQPSSSGGSTTSTKNFETHQSYALTIYLSSEIAHSARIWIYNDRFRIVARPEDGQYETFAKRYTLVSGQYSVRIEINGRITDNKVNLVSDWNCGIGIDAKTIQQQLALPTLYSSALLRRQDYYSEVHYDSTFEYYTDPAVDISNMTGTSLMPGYKNSGIFIFLRYPDDETYKGRFNKKSYWESFSLVDSSGNALLNFPESCVTDENPMPRNWRPGSGFIGLTLYAPQGMYFLKYSGLDARMIPIYVYNNWFTQFFMTVAEEPLFGTIRIFLSSSMTFNPYDRLQYYIDVCLSKLSKNDFTLDKDLLNNIAHGKYDSPMLGLLGAYIYLSSNETKDDSLFKLIVENLQNKILKDSDESPDIWALNLLSYKHFNRTLSANEYAFIDGTPTLRIAFDTIRKAAISNPWLIQEDSLNDHISENQYFDSAFNTFKPFSKDLLGLSRRQKLKGKRFKAEPTLEYSLRIAQPYSDNYLKRLPSDQIKDLSTTKNLTTTAHAILNLLAKKDNMRSIEVAETLNLPVNTVSRIGRELGLIE